MIVAVTGIIHQEIEAVAIEDVFQSKGRIKILKILATVGELNISEIGRKAHINHNSTRDHLRYLTKANLLQEKLFGRIRIYRFRTENIRARTLKNLFDIWENDLVLENLLCSNGRVKVIKILAGEGELNISEISKRAPLNHNSTRYHLNFLVKVNILQEKRFGRIRIYRYKMENMRARALKRLFDIWDETINQ